MKNHDFSPSGIDNESLASDWKEELSEAIETHKMMLDQSTQKSKELQDKMEQLDEENQRLKMEIQDPAFLDEDEDKPAVPASFPESIASDTTSGNRNLGGNDLFRLKEERNELRLELRQIQTELDEAKKQNSGLLQENDKLKRSVSSVDDEKQENLRLREMIEEKEEEIEMLRSQKKSTGDTSGGGADPKKLLEAEEKIKSLSNEVQNLMGEKISLKQEIAELQMGNMDRMNSLSPALPATSDFDAEREINSLKAQLIAREQRITEQTKQVTLQNQKISQLFSEKEALQKIIDEEEERKAEKKRKTWWGGKKKKKKRPEENLMPSGEESDASFGSGGTNLEPTGDYEVPTSPRQPKDIKQLKKELAAINKRNLELERENAKQEGEIKIMEKEKLTIEDEIKRILAQNDVLKKQNKDIQLRNPKSFTVPRSVAVPLPEDGGTETDKLRMTVQLQDAALREVALQKEQLSDQLDTYENVHRDYDKKHHKETEELKKQVKSVHTDLSESKAKTKKLEQSLKELESKEAILLNESHKLKKQLEESLELKNKMADKYQERLDVYASMLGTTLDNQEELSAKNSALQAQRAQDIKAMSGEVRALRAGRLKRMEGGQPTAPVFPSPQKSPKKVQISNEQPPDPQPAIKEESSSPSSPSTPSSPGEVAYKFHPEFGGYVLEKNVKKDPLRTKVTVKEKNQGLDSSGRYAPFPDESGLGESNPWHAQEDVKIHQLTASSEDKILAKEALSAAIQEKEQESDDTSGAASTSINETTWEKNMKQGKQRKPPAQQNHVDHRIVTLRHQQRTPAPVHQQTANCPPGGIFPGPPVGFCAPCSSPSIESRVKPTKNQSMEFGSQEARGSSSDLLYSPTYDRRTFATRREDEWKSSVARESNQPYRKAELSSGTASLDYYSSPGGPNVTFRRPSAHKNSSPRGDRDFTPKLSSDSAGALPSFGSPDVPFRPITQKPNSPTNRASTGLPLLEDIIAEGDHPLYSSSPNSKERPLGVNQNSTRAQGGSSYEQPPNHQPNSVASLAPRNSIEEPPAFVDPVFGPRKGNSPSGGSGADSLRNELGWKGGEGDSDSIGTFDFNF